MKKFTDGPWEVRGLDGDAPYIVALLGGNKWNDPTICNLYDDVTPSDSVTIGAWNQPIDNFKANAALISAAPELLEALERVVILIEIEDAALANYGEVEAARAAIAKAKGGNNAEV